MASAGLQQRTPAWHAARKGKLTASNVGAALGLCPWTSRNQAYQRAMGLDKFQGKAFSEMKGLREQTNFIKAVLGTGNEATRWGTNHESDGILAYTAHTGNVVNNTGLHVHKHSSWLAGSPDGLIGLEGLLEVKCPYYRKRDGSRLHKEIPMHYYMQMTLCLEVCERQWCDFISWSPEGYEIYRLTRDTELHELMMPHYLKFFAAMQRMATCPPGQSKEEKDSIFEAVTQSMKTHINYDYWRRVDTEVAPPTPEEESDDESPKRRKLDDFSSCETENDGASEAQ